MDFKKLRRTILLANELSTRPRGARKAVCEAEMISEATLSESLRATEATLGVSLFDGGRSQRLSRAGRELAEYGPIFLYCYDTLIEMVQTAGETASPGPANADPLRTSRSGSR